MSFGRLDRTAGTQPMSDINMTPLIDVMLVLLIIFMITAPLMTSSLRLDLPKTDGGTPNDAPLSIAVGLDAQGRTYFGDEGVEMSALSARLTEAARKNPNVEVLLRADQSVPYARVAELIGLVQRAGLSRVAFVTEPAAARPADRSSPATGPVAPARAVPGDRPERAPATNGNGVAPAANSLGAPPMVPRRP